MVVTHHNEDEQETMHVNNDGESGLKIPRHSKQKIL